MTKYDLEAVHHERLTDLTLLAEHYPQNQEYYIIYILYYTTHNVYEL